MELNLREALLVEKCLNCIIKDYEDVKRTDINSLIDLKLNFLSFLQSNELSEVLYGIQYIKLKYPDIAQVLGSMILEFETNRFNGSLYCKPLSDNKNQSSFKISFWQKIKYFYKSILDKIKCNQIIQDSVQSIKIKKGN